ncbi:hypothetical protein TeGR_g3436, partial [Tetraparma gracilis]
MDLLRRFSDAVMSPPPPGSPSGKARASSFSNFDVDQHTAVSPTDIDPTHMFDELDLNAPAGAAVLANQNFKESNLGKVSNKLIKKRIKLKNFRKDVKRSRRRRRSHIKGKKIDGKHEQ